MIFLKIIVGFIMMEIIGKVTRKITTGKWTDTESFKQAWDRLMETWKTIPVSTTIALFVMVCLCWLVGHVTLLPFL